MDNRDSSHEQTHDFLDFDVDMQSSETLVADSSTASTSHPTLTYQSVDAPTSNEDDMPALIEVSDSEDDQEDDEDNVASEVEMQTVAEEVTPAAPTAPRLPTFDFRRGFLNRPAAESPLSMRSNNRRARVDDDEDAERDRRHPSHRVSTPAAGSSNPLPPSPHVHAHAFAQTSSGVFPLPAQLTQAMGSIFESLFPRTTHNQAVRRSSPDNNDADASGNPLSSDSNAEAIGSNNGAQPESSSSQSRTTFSSSSSEPAVPSSSRPENPTTNEQDNAVPPAFITRSNVFGMPMNFRMRTLPDGGIALSGVAVDGENGGQPVPSAVPPTANSAGHAPVSPPAASVNPTAQGNATLPPPPQIRPGLNIGIALGGSLHALAGLPALAFGPPPQRAANGPQNANPAAGNAAPDVPPAGAALFGAGGPPPPAMLNLPPFMGGQFNFNLGGFNFGDLMEEKEDPERAKKLVEGLEEVPVGLVRRLERVGGMGGGMGESEDKGGDGGCAICWERLLIEDEVMEEEEDVAEKVDKGKHKVTVEDVPDPDAPIEEDIVMQATGSELVEGESKETSKYPKIVSLPCAHVFHAECLIPWFSRPRHTTCPTCRFNIDPDNLTYVSRRQRERERRARERVERGEPPEEEAEQEEDMFDDERGRNFMVDMLHLIASGARLRDAVTRRGPPAAPGNQVPQEGAQQGESANAHEASAASHAAHAAAADNSTPPVPGTTSIQTPQGAVNVQFMPIPIVVPIPVPAGGSGPRSGPTMGPPPAPASGTTEQPQGVPGDYPLIVVVPPLGPGTYVISNHLTPSFVVNVPTLPLRSLQAESVATTARPTPATAQGPQQSQGPSPSQQARPTPGEYLATMALHELLWPEPRRSAHPTPPPTGHPPFPWEFLLGAGPLPRPATVPNTPVPPPAGQPAQQSEAANNNNNNQPFTQVVQVSFDVLFPGLPLPGDVNGNAPPAFNFHNLNTNVLGDRAAGGPAGNQVQDGDMVVVMEGILGDGDGDDHDHPAVPPNDTGVPQPAQPAQPAQPQDTFQHDFSRFLDQLFGVAPLPGMGMGAGTGTGVPAGGVGNMTLGQLLRAMREGQPGNTTGVHMTAQAAQAQAAGATPTVQPQPGFRTFNNINELMEAVPILGGAGGGPAGARPNQPPPQFPIGSETFARRRNRRPRRENRTWAPPPPPGLTLRERIEKKEREAGLRCFDVSCCLAPTDDDIESAELVAPMRQLSIKAKDKSEVCMHRFHSSCLVTSERVALKGADVIVEDGTVEVTCPVCRHTGSVTQQEWDEGVHALM